MVQERCLLSVQEKKVRLWLFSNMGRCDCFPWTDLSKKVFLHTRSIFRPVGKTFICNAFGIYVLEGYRYIPQYVLYILSVILSWVNVQWITRIYVWLCLHVDNVLVDEVAFQALEFNQKYNPNVVLRKKKRNVKRTLTFIFFVNESNHYAFLRLHRSLW